MILNVGLNRIRDMVNTDMTYGILGTSSLAVNATQVSLGSSVSTTLLATAYGTADKAFTKTYILTSTLGNSTTFTEYANVRDAEATYYDRIVFTDVSKTSDKELHISKRYFFKAD